VEETKVCGFFWVSHISIQKSLIKNLKSYLFLSPMEVISSCGGVRHKRYNVQREQWFLKTKMVVLHKTKKAPVLQLMLS